MPSYGADVNLAVAAELRAQRARVRVSFDELAETTGLAKTTVLNYLNGKRSIPLPALAVLCRALEIGMDEIFVLAVNAVKKN
jgi:transcriptional regulator with XRE-family HTH domain